MKRVFSLGALSLLLISLFNCSGNEQPRQHVGIGMDPAVCYEGWDCYTYCCWNNKCDGETPGDSLCATTNITPDECGGTCTSK